MSQSHDRRDVGEPGGIGGVHSRRTFLKGMGFAAGGAAIAGHVYGADGAEMSAEDPDLQEFGRDAQEIKLNINGKTRRVTVEPRTTLLDALREGLDMTGSKEVCDRGSCGCCTVLMDGKAVTSCLVLAMDAVGSEVMTIEGIAESPKYRRLIESYCEHDGAQCGFCIPGFVVRSAAFLEENPSPNGEEVRHGLSGNICRCGTYSMIFNAVEAAGNGAAK